MSYGPRATIIFSIWLRLGQESKLLSIIFFKLGASGLELGAWSLGLGTSGLQLEAWGLVPGPVLTGQLGPDINVLHRRRLELCGPSIVCSQCIYPLVMVLDKSGFRGS